MHYYPYGVTRSGAMNTDRRYTGQRWEASLGLYDYGARFYSPGLGRFASRFSYEQLVRMRDALLAALSGYGSHINAASQVFDLPPALMGYISNPSDEQLREMLLNPETAILLAAANLSNYRDFRLSGWLALYQEMY